MLNGRRINLFLLLCAAVFVGACNIVGPLGYFVAGPPAIPAVYVPDPKQIGVVFIDDRSNQVPTRGTREIIGRIAEEEMLANGVFLDMVQSRRVQSVVSAERYGHPLAIADVGEAVQAQTVVYAVVDKFVLSEDGTTFAPVALLRVKVVDVATKKRLFPAEDSPEEYQPLAVRVPTQTGSVPPSNNARTQAFQDLARWTGRSLARMFYDFNEISRPSRLGE